MPSVILRTEFEKKEVLSLNKIIYYRLRHMQSLMQIELIREFGTFKV